MKYLGVLLVVTLVLMGSVAMAGAYRLEKWGGFSTGLYNWTSIGPIDVVLQVWVYPYLYLTIDYTGFRWHLYEAAGGDEYPTDPAQQWVATATIKTNWPKVTLTFSGFGNPKKGNNEIEAWWGLEIPGVLEPPIWKRATEIDSNTFHRDVPFVGNEVSVRILNKIKLPSQVQIGQYSNTGTITATLPTSYWP